VVSSEATGMSALQAIMEQRPQLVVLDLGLPDVDGEDLLRTVRAVSQVPIVVVTALVGVTSSLVLVADPTVVTR
jgi:DNA-binding response OmpR family regulator